MRRTRAIALALAALLVPAIASSKPTGFQVEVDGMGAQPVWSGSSGTVRLGGGSGVRLLYGASRHLYFGASIVYFENRRDYANAVQLPGPPGRGLRSPRDSSGALILAPGRRALATLPFEGVMQLRTDRTTRLNGYAEFGAGVTTTQAKLTLGEESVSAIEQDPSIHVGGGAVYALGRNWEMTANLVWHQAWSSGGKVWSQHDAPRYVTFGLGIRYPRF